MWTVIWIILIIASIVTPVFLLYKLFMKILGFIQAFDMQIGGDRIPYELSSARKTGVLADSNHINETRRQRIEIKTIRLERKYERLDRVIEKWRRYGLLDD